MSICSCAEAAEPPPESKLPKAALQQLCQKQQWPPPKFDRLPPGGHRLAHAGIRYSVTLFMPASSGPRKKKVMPALNPFLAEENLQTVSDERSGHSSGNQRLSSIVSEDSAGPGSPI